MKVIGYLRVWTSQQEYGIEAQRRTVEAQAELRGWTVEWIEDAGRSGKDINRPGISSALDQLKRGEAEALVVSKHDRLGRSLADFARLLETASKQGWGVVAIDLGIDTTTPTGELVANIMASVSRWERQVIGLRTREGLAVAKANGVRLGSPVLMDPAVEERIVADHAAGRTLTAIAAGLSDDQTVVSGRGGRFYPSTIRGVLARARSVS